MYICIYIHIYIYIYICTYLSIYIYIYISQLHLSISYPNSVYWFCRQEKKKKKYIYIHTSVVHTYMCINILKECLIIYIYIYIYVVHSVPRPLFLLLICIYIYIYIWICLFFVPLSPCIYMCDVFRNVHPTTTAQQA